MTQFRTYMIDPPWPENGGGKIQRGANRHYPTMPVKQIVPTILECPLFRPPEHAHLYLWTTNNFLPAALQVTADIGFRYVTMVTWAKDRSGLGQYFRGQTEHMLFAVRGKGYNTKTERKDLSTLIQAPRTKEHSRKPQEAYELIEARSVGPYFEMFGRGKPRENWEIWGHEAEPETPTVKPVTPERFETEDEYPDPDPFNDGGGYNEFCEY